MVVPPYLVCFLTGQIFVDPVFLTSGNSYEREAVLKYFEEKGSVDPQTGKSVNPDIVVANLTLKVLLD